MPRDKIDRAQRRAAGMVMLSLFATSEVVTHGLRQVAARNPPSGAGTGAGLTEKERAMMATLQDRYHNNGELIRKMAWRLLNREEL